MQLDQLRPDEKRVFVGLYFWVMHADGVVSAEETAAMAELRARLGPAAWDGLVRDAQQTFPEVRRIAAACRTVDRPAARQTIYEELVRLAAVDRFDPSEVKLLNWLARTWGFVSRAEAERAEASLAAQDDGFDLLG